MKFKPLLIILFLAFSLSVLAQQNTPEPEVKPCDAQSAMLLVQGQAEIGRKVQDSEKRIKILVKTADFLWKYDQDSARKYFLDAYQTARERYKESGNEKPKEQFTLPSVSDYRLFVIKKIASHDAKWANELLQELVKEIEEEIKAKKTETGDSYKRLEELLNAAEMVFKTDRKAGLNIARAAFRLDFAGIVWLRFLFQIAKTDQKTADDFYVEVLNRAGQEKITEFLYLFSYPFAQQRGIGVRKLSVFNVIEPQFSPNPNLQKLFLNALLVKAQAFIENPSKTNSPMGIFNDEGVNAFSAFQDLEPIVEIYQPEFLSRIQAFKTQLMAFVTPQDRVALEQTQKRGVISEMPFQERLADLENIKDELMFNQLLIGLILQSQREEDFEAVEPWLEKITDSETKVQVTQYFYYQRSMKAVNDKRLEDARKYAEKVEGLDFRSILLLSIANEKLKNEIERQDADDILRETEKIALRAEDSVAKVRALTGVAFLYENLDVNRALDVLASAVKSANKIEGQDIFSSSVQKSIIKPGKFAFFTVYSLPGFGFEATFTRLSRRNFDLTLAEARSLSDKYWQTLAVIATIQECVAEVKPPEKKQETPKTEKKKEPKSAGKPTKPAT